MLLLSKKVSHESIPAHCEMSKRLQQHARATLRRMIKENPDWATDALDADVIVEQVWNALTGLDRLGLDKEIG
jgi:hypothetical protein